MADKHIPNTVAGVARVNDPVVVRGGRRGHGQRLGLDLRFDRRLQRGIGILVDLLDLGLPQAAR